MPTTTRIALLFLFAATATLLAAGPALGAPYETSYGDPAPVEAASYSYVRVLDGAGTLTQGDSGEREQLELNQPVLSGDRVWVSPRSRLELVLSDLNVLRLDADTEVAFDQLAYSPEGREVVTSVRLFSGNLQLEVSEESLGEDPPTIELPFATVYVMEPGSYRVTCYEYGVCWVVSRDGAAEVVTDRGSVLLRRDEAVYLEQDARGSAYAEAAPARDELERWGERLTIEARRADLRGVDPSLRYGAAPLAEHGDWVEVDSSWAWRPNRVSSDWRPYWDGHWRYTPSGLLWVSSEPWGWTTYHYGTWNHHPHFGWVWHPGHVFAPAWVYWYWGPSQVAWVPAGYYTHHYRPRYRGFDFHFGIYGYAGGHHRHYRDWIFCDIDRFGRRHDFRRHLYTGHDFERRHRGSVVPRGVITTDTRGLSSDRWQRSVDVLEERSRRVALPRNGVRAQADVLPDVTPFVAREPELSDTVQRRVVTPRRGATRVSAEGMPFETPDVRERPNVRERPDVEGSAPGARRRAAVTRGQGGDRPAAEPSAPEAQRPVISTDGREGRAGRAVGGDADRGEPTRRRVFVRPDAPQRTPDAAPRAGASGRTDDRPGATRSPSVRPGSERGGVTRRPDVRQRAFEPRQPVREAAPQAAPQEGATSERRRVFVRPDGRTRVGGGDAGSRSDGRSDAGRRPVVRPSTPERRDGRDSTGTTERPVRPSPAWRPGPSERRPSVRPSSPTPRRPAVRPSAPRSQPEARSAPRDSRRPEARSSRPSTSRGSEARGGGSRSSRRPEASSGSGGSRNRSSASSSRGSDSRRGSASGSRGGARRRGGSGGD